ncbi:dynamin-related protein 4C-like [Bidens hawaiensis]|uniref:dynamin-related protein 4C-like n=1 Tax=Bidens hawaiensis TaxID=980011 RepID=UPI0040495FFA
MGTGDAFGFFYVEHDVITVRDENSFTKVSTFLANIDKRFVGYQAISKNLVLGILSLLFSPSCEIFTKLESDLLSSKIELRRCQNTFESASEAMAAIASFVTSASSSLKKLILKDYTEFQKEPDMHVATQLESRFQMYNISLQELKFNTEEPFLIREIGILQSGNWPNLSDFVYSNNVKPLLEDQFSFASLTIESFVTSLTGYLEMVIGRLLLEEAIDHVALHRPLKWIARELIHELKKAFERKIQEHIDLEKNLVYTSNLQFATQVEELKNVKLNLQQGQDVVNIDAMGDDLKVGHLTSYTSNQIETAFGIKNFMMVYFDYVVNRLVDCSSLHFHHMVTHMWARIVEKVMKKCMVHHEHAQSDEELTLVAKRLNLDNRVALLRKIRNEIIRLQS